HDALPIWNQGRFCRIVTNADGDATHFRRIEGRLAPSSVHGEQGRCNLLYRHASSPHGPSERGEGGIPLAFGNTWFDLARGGKEPSWYGGSRHEIPKPRRHRRQGHCVGMGGGVPTVAAATDM